MRTSLHVIVCLVIPMFIRTPGFLVLLLVVGLAGCSDNRSSKQKAEERENRKVDETQPDPKGNSVGDKFSKQHAEKGVNLKVNETQPDPKGKLGTEAEARAILKKALDSWAFGDSREKIERDQPGIKFLDRNCATGKKLSRSEIGMSRKIDESKHGVGFQFLVTLTCWQPKANH